MNTNKNKINVEVIVNASLKYVWEKWIKPEDIVKWNFASEDWHTAKATNDLRVGGKFCYRMEARDGSMGFDFEGIYTKVFPFELIEYLLGDDREVKITFASSGKQTIVEETFDPENENSLELQKSGWQAILNNFKKYVESKNK